MQTNYLKRKKDGISLTRKCESTSNDLYLLLESSLKRDFIETLEFDYNVWYYKLRPVEIAYTMSGIVNNYIPDFLVHYRTDLYPAKKFRPLLCEIISRNELRSHWKQFKPRFLSAIKYASEKGWRFKIITEIEINTPFFDNVKFLSNYKGNRNTNIDDFSLILDKLKVLKITTPEELILIASKDKYKQAELLFTIWYMIAEGFISCDLTRKLTMQTEIW
jgi:hypothetical protein